jgi:hypothetical protein
MKKVYWVVVLFLSFALRSQQSYYFAFIEKANTGVLNLCILKDSSKLIFPLKIKSLQERLCIAKSGLFFIQQNNIYFFDDKIKKIKTSEIKIPGKSNFFYCPDNNNLKDSDIVIIGAYSEIAMSKSDFSNDSVWFYKHDIKKNKDILLAFITQDRIYSISSDKNTSFLYSTQKYYFDERPHEENYSYINIIDLKNQFLTPIDSIALSEHINDSFSFNPVNTFLKNDTVTYLLSSKNKFSWISISLKNLRKKEIYTWSNDNISSLSVFFIDAAHFSFNNGKEIILFEKGIQKKIYKKTNNISYIKGIILK